MPRHSQRDGDVIPRPAVGTGDLHGFAKARLIGAYCLKGD
jgi:hypothetical protein